MQWKMCALLAIMIAGIALAAEAGASGEGYEHYCYRTCCLNADAAYVEGPPQDCIGAGPDFSENLARCRELCLLEMNITGGVIGEGEMIEYVDRGVVYVPDNGSVENESVEEEGADGNAAVSGNATMAMNASEEGQPGEIEGGQGQNESGGEEGNSGDAEGGACIGAFALLMALFAMAR
jgi:hypothetical protein